MKKLLIIATVLGLSSAAIAADLPKKSAPLPPVRSEASLPFFVGINAGDVHNSDNYTLGATAGVQLSDNVAAELAYDRDHDNNADLVTGNILVQAKRSFITPYVLGGIGHRWADQNEYVWNVGGGAKVALTDNIDFDVRYRHIVGYDTKQEDNVITGGIIFKF